MLSVVIGIFGGTFDPPHVGHLAVAHAAVEQLGIDRVRWVPAGQPWQKTDHGVSAAGHRLAMAHLAAAEDQRFEIDDIEIRRSGPSYTIDTVRELGQPCVLILGTDAALGIPGWKGGGDLVDLTEVAVVERPGASVDDVRAALGCDVHELHMPPIELSATRLREHIRAGRSPRYLVPDAVCDYILANGLYT